MEHLGRSPVAQGLMEPQPIVEPEIVFQSPLGFQDAGVGLSGTGSSYLSVRHSLLHENVVLIPPLAVHADIHAPILQHLGEAPNW